MSMNSGREMFTFWLNWTIQHTWAIPVSYVISLVVILLFVAAFGISMSEFGTPVQQLVMQTTGSAVLGLGVGLLQLSLLQKVFGVTRLWIWCIMAGFILAELVAGFICGLLGLNRMQLRFLEGNAWPESLVFALAGLLTGILQWLILKKHFNGSVYWIMASMIAWSMVVLVMACEQWVPPIRNSSLELLVYVLVFLLGSTLYGAVTGAALLRIIKGRKPEQGLN